MQSLSTENLDDDIRIQNFQSASDSVQYYLEEEYKLPYLGNIATTALRRSLYEWPSWLRFLPAKKADVPPLLPTAANGLLTKGRSNACALWANMSFNKLDANSCRET